MNKIVDIFLQPSQVYAAERERPTFLVPALLLAAGAVAFTLAYFMRVDPSWYADHMFDASGTQMSAKQMAQAKASMPGTRVMGVIGALGSVVTIALVLALGGLYYWLASKVTGRALGYRHGLSLSAWSAMPGLLGTVVGLVGALMMSPQTGIESLMLTHVDPLFVQLPADARWNRLAEAADLLTLWTVFLSALGWRTFTRSSWTQALVVALLPAALIYGVISLLP